MKKMGEKQERVVVRGLRDVAAAETKISYVNSNGTLYYLG
jgi:citrate synthase